MQYIGYPWIFWIQLSSWNQLPSTAECKFTHGPYLRLNNCIHSSYKTSDLKIHLPCSKSTCPAANLLALHFCMIMSSPNWQIREKCGVACILYLVVTSCCFDTRIIIIIIILYKCDQWYNSCKIISLCWSQSTTLASVIKQLGSPCYLWKCLCYSCSVSLSTLLPASWIIDPSNCKVCSPY